MDINWDYPGQDESYGQAAEKSAEGNTPAKGKEGECDVGPGTQRRPEHLKGALKLGTSHSAP